MSLVATGSMRGDLRTWSHDQVVVVRFLSVANLPSLSSRISITETQF